MAENTVTIAEASRMPITLFVAELKKACERHDGYIMGATGQNPRRAGSEVNEQNQRRISNL